MIKAYEYLIDGPGQFIVLKRWVDKEGKQRLTEYLVSYKKGKWMCDPKCKGFWMNKNRDKKPCHHIKFIKSQLKEKNLGVLRQKSNFDWVKELKYVDS